MVLEDSEELRMCQSDMTSAFYLFSLPSSWQRFLAFNLQAKGEDIGLRAGVLYCLACKVLPMGWASAVSVMQEVSQALLNHGGLPRGEQVLRTKPLPTWLTEVLKAARVTSTGGTTSIWITSSRGSAWEQVMLVVARVNSIV